MPGPFAVITGASSGIGRDLARLALAEGFTVLAVADDDAIFSTAAALGPQVEALRADLATDEGVTSVVDAVAGRRVYLLAANAGKALGHSFLDQSIADIRRVIDTNVTGTVELLHRLLPAMVTAGEGRVLITGSIAGYMTGPGLAIYNASKAFLNLFSDSLREELRNSGVTITCLRPGATETPIFDRAGIGDSPIGRQEKDDPADVAQAGLRAALAGKASVVTGWKSKLQVVGAQYGPSRLVARAHRKATDPDVHP